jgi:ankyrin repeat protein
MSSGNDPTFRLNLEQQRKRARELQRAHREGRADAAERIVRHLPRARGRSVGEVLGAGLTLVEAQLVVAREEGYASWPQMKRAVETGAGAGDVQEALIEAAFAGDETQVAALRARDPAVRLSLPAAAALADREVALALLDAEPAPASRPGGRRGWPPLLYLCCSAYGAEREEVEQARLAIARRLIELGADVNASAVDPARTAADNRDVTFERTWHALMGAAGRVRSAELVRLLLAAGARSDSSGFLGAAMSSGDGDILRLALGLPWKWWQVASPLMATAEMDDQALAVELARQLVAKDPSPRVSERALVEAIRRQRGPALIEVLMGDDSQLELRRPVWQAGYRAAVRFGNDQAAELLRRRGADPARVSPVDRAIGACVRGDGAELGRLLASGVYSPRALQFEDHRVLSWAVRTGRGAAVPLLLTAGLDPNFVDVEGETPVHLAVAAGDPAMLDRLLRAGGRANGRNLDGWTPLELARALPDSPAREAMVNTLTAAGASPVAPPPDGDDQADRFERAADAVVAGDLDQLRALLDADPALVHARSPRPHRCTLLHYCGANGVEQYRQQTPANAAAVAQLLLERGAEVDAIARCYSQVDTPLYLMMTSGGPTEAGLDGALTRVFAQAGARIDWGNEDGPMIWAIDAGLPGSALALAEAGLRMDNLLFAAAANRVDVLQDLLAGGAEVNARFWAGYTALHAAAVMGHLEAVELLLARGADPSLREEKYGDTPAEKARWREHARVLARLEGRTDAP